MTQSAIPVATAAEALPTAPQTPPPPPPQNMFEKRSSLIPSAEASRPASERSLP